MGLPVILAVCLSLLTSTEGANQPNPNQGGTTNDSNSWYGNYGFSLSNLPSRFANAVCCAGKCIASLIRGSSADSAADLTADTAIGPTADVHADSKEPLLDTRGDTDVTVRQPNGHFARGRPKVMLVGFSYTSSDVQ